MKKATKILGLIMILCGAVSLLLSRLMWYAAFHTHDATAGTFKNQLKLAMIFAVAGILLFVIGIKVLKLGKTK